MNVGAAFPAARELEYVQLRDELTAEVESVKYTGALIESLLNQFFSFNYRLTAPGGQTVRISPRLKFLDLCDVVDPSSDRPRDRGSGAYIRIPAHMIEMANKLVCTSRQFLHETGREATPEELAERLLMPLAKIRAVMKIAKEPVSLDFPVGEEEDSKLGDFIEDKDAVIPVNAATHANLKENVTHALSALTPREERVLRMRFGIGMDTDHTLEKAGQQFGVTRERIPQIEAKALKKLSHPSRATRIRSSLD